MMTPAEISALLGIDETELTDDINTLGHPARRAFFHGVAITAREIREDVLMPYSDLRILQPTSGGLRAACMGRPRWHRAQQQSHKRLLPLQLRHRRGPPREQEAHQGLAVPKNRRGHHAPNDARTDVHLRKINT